MAKITKKHIIAELIKCGKDPLYFINTYAKIQHPVRGLITFNMFNYQQDLIHGFLNNRFNIILKARQLGVTTTMAAYIAWFILFHRDKNVLVVATKQKVAKNTIRMIRNIFKYLPKWMMDIGKAGDQKENLNNRHSVELANGSRVEAVTTTDDVGRTEAVSLLVVDEAAHIKVFDEIWTGLWPTVSCVSGDTRVVTNKGIRKIKDFCKNREIGEYFEIDDLEVWGKDGHLEKVSHGYVSPDSDTLVIKTKKGLEVEVTKKHPLLKLTCSGGEMTKSKDLKIGDYLRIDVGMRVWPNGENHIPYEKGKSLSYMLGGFIAEGWITNNDSLIEISNEDEEFRKVFLENDIVKPFVSKNNDSCRMRCSSVELVNLFKKAGINSEWKCDTKRVPEGIWVSNKSAISSFLQGYFDGDGFVGTTGVVAKSTSERLLKDVQQLLLNFGIISSINKCEVDKEKEYGRTMPSGQKLQSLKDSYILTIPRSFFSKFAKEIGFKIKRKQDKLLQLSDVYSDDTRKQFKIPLSVVCEKITEILMATGKNQKWFRERGLRIEKIRTGKNINNLWIKKLRYLVLDNDLDVGSFQNMVFLKEMSGSCFWDEIVSITPSKNITYDFTVPGSHSFLQNGIMGSNTGGSVALFSTPNGTGNFFHKEYMLAKSGESNFNCRFGTYTNPKDPNESYDDRLMWWVHPEHDDAWFAHETAGKSPRDIAQEYLCNFNASGDTFIWHEDITRIEQRIQTEMAPAIFHLDRNVWIWEDPIPGATYLISCDVSRGDAADYSAFHVIRLDGHPLVQVAEYKGKIRPDSLGMLLVSVSQIYNNAMIAPENNSGWSGQTILKIQEANHPFLYYSRKRKPKVKSRHAPDPYYAEVRNDYLPGYAVTSANRNAMLAKLEQFVRMGDIIVNSQRLIDEFKTFIVTEANRPEAQRGMNDDLVMALAGGLWVRDESFMHYRGGDAMAEAMLDAMGVSNTNTKQFQDFNFNTSIYDRTRIKEHVERQNKIVMGNGDVVDLNWLLRNEPPIYNK